LEGYKFSFLGIASVGAASRQAARLCPQFWLCGLTPFH
jgi:hypothetical protein